MRRLWACVTLLVFVGACAEESDSHRQSSTRPFGQPMLMVFAQYEHDPRLEEQRRQVGGAIALMDEKGVRLVEIVGDDPARRALVVPEEGFHVLLLDKDGNVLFQFANPVAEDVLRRGIKNLSGSRG